MKATFEKRFSKTSWVQAKLIGGLEKVLQQSKKTRPRRIYNDKGGLDEVCTGG